MRFIFTSEINLGEKSDFDENITKLKSEIKALKEANQGFKEQNDDLQKENSEIYTKNAKIEEENSKMILACTNINATKDTLEKEVKNLKEELDQKTTTNSSATDFLKTVKQALLNQPEVG